MTTPFPPDDEPLDLGAVGRDDELLEALRAGDADASLLSDPALAALGALLDDVAQGLPEPGVLVARGSAPADAPVLPLRRRRTASRAALVAAVGVGVLSLGGVAAATPGSPLRPVRDAVASAVGGTVQDLVAAVTPDEPFDPTGDRPRSAASPSPTATATTAGTPSAAPRTSAPSVPTGTPSARASRPAPAGVRSPQATSGASVSAASRSRSAANRVSAALARADEALDAGQLKAADAHLDTAERALPDVSAADGRARLQQRYEALRARLDAAQDARPSDRPREAGSRPERTGAPGSSARPASPRADSSSPRPSRTARSGRGDVPVSAAPRASKPVRTPKAAAASAASAPRAAGRS